MNLSLNFRKLYISPAKIVKIFLKISKVFGHIQFRCLTSYFSAKVQVQVQLGANQKLNNNVTMLLHLAK